MNQWFTTWYRRSIRPTGSSVEASKIQTRFSTESCKTGSTSLPRNQSLCLCQILHGKQWKDARLQESQKRFLNTSYEYTKSRNSVVGIATGYGLDDHGSKFESRLG
jgi:hypothetical protein